jgi:hypothetical protein
VVRYVVYAARDYWIMQDKLYSVKHCIVQNDSIVYMLFGGALQTWFERKRRILISALSLSLLWKARASIQDIQIVI